MHREVQIKYDLMTHKCKKAIKIAIFHVSSPSGIFLGFYSTCTCDSLMPNLKQCNINDIKFIIWRENNKQFKAHE